MTCGCYCFDSIRSVSYLSIISCKWTLTPLWSRSLCYVRLTHDLWMLLFWFNQPVSYLSIISCNEHYTPSWSLSLCYVRLTHDLWMLLFWFNQPVSYLSIFHTMNTNSIMIPFSLLCSFNSRLVDATVLIQSVCKLPQHYFIQWTLTPSWSLSLCYVRLTHDLWMLLFWFNQPVSYLSIISCNEH